MTRRDVWWTVPAIGCGVLFAGGCGGRAQPLAEVFPREIEGRRLTHVDPLSLDGVSSDIRRLGARAAAHAVYEGADKIDVTLYDMTNRKSAYAALRLARATDKSAPFYHDRYFGTAESTAAPASFARAFEKQLAAR